MGQEAVRDGTRWTARASPVTNARCRDPVNAARPGLLLAAMQVSSRAGRHPLEIQSIAKSPEGRMPRPFEETLPHHGPGNRRHRSRVECSDPAVDLGGHVGSASWSRCTFKLAALQRGQCGPLLRAPMPPSGALRRHVHISILATSRLTLAAVVRVTRGERGRGTQTREHRSPG
jgi:hypothetical protein